LQRCALIIKNAVNNMLIAAYFIVFNKNIFIGTKFGWIFLRAQKKYIDRQSFTAFQ